MKKVHKHTKNVSHLVLYTLMYPSGICYQGVCNSLERTDSFAWESDFFTLFVIRVISAFTSGIRLVIMSCFKFTKVPATQESFTQESDFTGRAVCDSLKDLACDSTSCTNY